MRRPARAGKFNLPHGLQVDHQGNVYVADRGNNRYVVLDNDLKPKTTYTNLGTAWSDCISQGPHQYLFVSNSNPNGNAPGSWQRRARSTRWSWTAPCWASSAMPASWRRASRWFT